MNGYCFRDRQSPIPLLLIAYFHCSWDCYMNHHIITIGTSAGGVKAIKNMSVRYAENGSSVLAETHLERSKRLSSIRF